MLLNVTIVKNTHQFSNFATSSLTPLFLQKIVLLKYFDASSVAIKIVKNISIFHDLTIPIICMMLMMVVMMMMMMVMMMIG